MPMAVLPEAVGLKTAISLGNFGFHKFGFIIIIIHHCLKLSDRLI